MSKSEIKETQNIGGKEPLPLCEYCISLNIRAPTIMGRTNHAEKKTRERAQKAKQLQSKVKLGLRKDTKEDGWFHLNVL